MCWPTQGLISMSPRGRMASRTISPSFSLLTPLTPPLPLAQIHASPLGGPLASPSLRSMPSSTVSLERARLAFWQDEYRPQTRKVYNSREKKWVAFCATFGFSSKTPPSQHEFELFVTWLATSANKGAPLVATTIRQYVNHLGSFFDVSFPKHDNPAKSLLTQRLVKAVCWRLDRPKDRARPLKLAELQSLMSSARRSLRPYQGAFVAFVASLAFWGCLRLGTILQPKDVKLAVIRWSDIRLVHSERGLAIDVTIYRDKTLNAAFPSHPIRIYSFARDISVCPVAAYNSAVFAAQRVGLQAHHPIGSSDSGGQLSMATFLFIINAAIPPLSTKPIGSKRHFTGHSFRRGHVQAALDAGVAIDDIALFGNWKSYISIRNYTVSVTVASRLNEMLSK